MMCSPPCPDSGDDTLVYTEVLCAAYVDENGDSLCTAGSTLAPEASCGDDDECSQSECCVDGETGGTVCATR